MGDSLIKK